MRNIVAFLSMYLHRKREKIFTDYNMAGIKKLP